MTHRPPTPRAQQKVVDAWNAKYPVGQPVTVNRDSGEQMETVTRTPAQLLSGHTAVVWIEGIASCYALTHVKARKVAV